MKVQRDELLSYVEILGNFYKEDDFSEWSKYLYFRDNKIISYDGRKFIQIAFKFGVKDFIVPYKEFYKILQEIKSKEIDIKVEQSKIQISSNNIKIELLKKEKDNLKILEFIFEDAFKKLPNDFLKAIKSTRFCGNQSYMDSSGYLTIQNNQIYCTDKFRICKYKLNSNIDDCLIPLDCINILLKIDIKEYLVNSNYCLFRRNDIIIGIIAPEIERLDYAKYNYIFEAKDTIQIILPEDIKQTLALSNIFTDKNIYQKEIEFIIKDKKLFCKSQNEVGTILCEASINCDLDLSFFIHPLFLIDILNICSRMELQNDLVLFRTELFYYFFRISR